MLLDDQIDTGPSSPAWRDYRRKRALACLVFLGGFVALFGLANTFHFGAAAATVLFFAWVVPSLITWNRWIRWRCPRCGRLFRRTLWGHVIARTCAHCGLERPALRD